MPATEVSLPSGELVFRKYTDSKPLRELAEQVVELTIRLNGIGHINVMGRVRIVSETPAIWVAGACLPYDVEVYKDSYDEDAYICELKGN